jgi:hypothetical protein
MRSSSRSVGALLVAMGLLASACGSSVTDGAVPPRDPGAATDSASGSSETTGAANADLEARDAAPDALALSDDVAGVAESGAGVATIDPATASPLLVACGDRIDAATRDLDPASATYSDDVRLALADPAVATDCAVLADPAASGLDQTEVYNFMLLRFPIELLSALADAAQQDVPAALVD